MILVPSCDICLPSEERLASSAIISFVLINVYCKIKVRTWRRYWHNYENWDKYKLLYINTLMSFAGGWHLIISELFILIRHSVFPESRYKYILSTFTLPSQWNFYTTCKTSAGDIWQIKKNCVGVILIDFTQGNGHWLEICIMLRNC